MVPLEDIAGLVKCMDEDNCKVRRSLISSEGHHFCSVRIVTGTGVEIRYLLDEDNSLMIMAAVGDIPILIEDNGFTGKVKKITAFSNEIPNVFEEGERNFETNYPMAQLLYYMAMEHAKKNVIPENRSIRKEM